MDLGVAFHIAHAVAAAQIQLLRQIAPAVMDGTDEGHHHDDRPLEHVLPEDLGPHVTVEPGHVQVGLRQRQPHEGLRLAGLDGHAKLGIHLAGADGGVGMGIDAGGDPKQHLLAQIPAGGLRLQGQQLLHPVHHETAHPRVHSEGDILIRLVVPMIIDLLHGEACGLGGVYLPGGDHVQPQALLPHDAAHLAEGGGLAGVQDHGALGKAFRKGVPVKAAVVPDPVLIHEIQGGPVGLRQLQGVLAGEAQVPVLPIQVGTKGRFGVQGERHAIYLLRIQQKRPMRSRIDRS